MHITFWIVHSLFLTEYIVLSGDIIVKSIIQKATEMLNACQKMTEKLWAWHSYNVILTCFSSVHKTVKKELHVMQNKIIRFIKGFDNRKRVNMISFLNHVSKFYILPN